MPKSQSPAKPRGRPKSKSDSKVEKGRSKSRGRTKSRGRSPTPKAPKARKPSVKRSVSRPRSRARSKSRKSEPTKSESKPRSRSASRSSSAAAKKAATPEKKAEPQPTRVSRRTIAAREASKGKTVVDGPAERRAPEKVSKASKLLQWTLNTILNFGYRTTLMGLFWFIVLPLYVGLLHLFCTRDRCYPRWPIVIPNSYQTYLDPIYIMYGGAAVLVQGFLSAIPLGPIVTGFGYRRAIYKYRSNGLLCLILSCAMYYLLVHHFQFNHAYITVTNRFKCVCAMTVISLCCSITLWAKSYRLRNSHTNHGSSVSYAANGNFIHDLAHGREVSPKVGETYDLSLVLLRSANFIWAVNLFSAVMTSKTERGYNHDVLCLALAQGIHIFLGSYYEMNILKSAFINQGVGFITVFSCLVITPFCHSLPVRYVLDNKAYNEPLPVYIAVFVVYCVGLFLIFHTNCAKYQNARSGGKKVLRTGCYAFVRHPNYLGELLCLVASTFLCGKAVLTWVHCVYLLSLLFCRMRLMEKNTNYEYKQYAEQVRSRLIPFIY